MLRHRLVLEMLRVVGVLPCLLLLLLLLLMMMMMMMVIMVMMMMAPIDVVADVVGRVRRLVVMMVLWVLVNFISIRAGVSDGGRGLLVRRLLRVKTVVSRVGCLRVAKGVGGSGRCRRVQVRRLDLVAVVVVAAAAA